MTASTGRSGALSGLARAAAEKDAAALSREGSALCAGGATIVSTGAAMKVTFERAAIATVTETDASAIDVAITSVFNAPLLLLSPRHSS